MNRTPVLYALKNGFDRSSFFLFRHMLNSYNDALNRGVDPEGSCYLNDIKTVQRMNETAIADCRSAGTCVEPEGER